MTDLALEFIDGHGDLVLAGDDLASDAGLNTAILLSLFCDARASAGEIEAGADPRGWWADTWPAHDGDAIGSQLWGLEREKQLPELRQRIQHDVAAALAWLTEDGIGVAVTVIAAFPERGRLTVDITIERPHGAAPFNRQYQYVWSSYE